MKRTHIISGKSALKPNYFSISTDSRTLISNAHSLDSGEGQYETVKFWDLLTGELISTVDFRHDHLSVSYSEKWLLGIVYNADVIITQNLETDGLYLILDAAPRCLGHYSLQESNVTPLAASPYEPIIVCGAQPRDIAAYNLLAEPRCSDGYAMSLPAQYFRSQYSSSNSSILISPDSNVLLSQALSINCGFHHLWNLQTGELIRTFNASNFGLAECLSVSQTGFWLACGSIDGHIQVYSISALACRTLASSKASSSSSISARLCNSSTISCHLSVATLPVVLLSQIT